MKLTSVDMNTYNYDDFVNHLCNDMSDKFLEKGLSALYLGKIIQYLRKEFTEYFTQKYSKKIKFIIILPRNNYDLIDKEVMDKRKIVKVYLSYEKISDYLLGNDTNFEDYLYQIIDRVESILRDNTNHFDNYLIIQMDNLVDICFNELSIYNDENLKENLLKSICWKKFSYQSSVFNDYYKFYLIDKENNRKVFYQFLYKLYKKCENSDDIS